MRWQPIVLACLMTLPVGGIALGQQAPASHSTPTAKSPAKKTPPAPSSDSPNSAPDAPDAGQTQSAAPDPDTELQMLVQQAANDSAALIKNLEAYLGRYPQSPRRAAIYRAMVESEMQLHDEKDALDYAEKEIALAPDDMQTMYLAVTILEKMPDDASHAHAIDYDTRLIEQVAEANPDSRPPQMTLDDWQAGRNKFTMQLYIVRGRIDRHLHKDDDAVKDLTSSFQILPTAEAALDLGEIAEGQKHSDEAIRRYAQAFFLSQEGKDDDAVNRDSLRLRMGNLWRFTHDSNAGLGDVLLAAFDKNKELSEADQPDAPVYNQGVTDPLQFSLRLVDGKDSVKMPAMHGKIVILNFWTTWCAYCRTLEPLLGQVRTKFAGRDDVVSLAVNADQDIKVVAPFLQEQTVDGTVVFADGLDQAFHVEAIPTIIVLDRSGKIAYRMQGYAPDGFVDLVSAAITKASATQ
jgi:thiol-disulfide isomerase/thioredoxin